MPRNRSKTSTPKPELSSSPISEKPLPVMPGAEHSPTSSNPQDAGDLPSYRPPGAVKSTPTPPPSAMEESPSVMRSTPTSPSPKEQTPQPLPKELNDAEPARDSIHGAGGHEYLEWAARNMDDATFRDYYEHRAGELLAKFDTVLDAHAAARLLKLI